MIRDSRQPVEAHFHVVSDFRREIYDDSLAHPVEGIDGIGGIGGPISAGGTARGRAMDSRPSGLDGQARPAGQT